MHARYVEPTRHLADLVVVNEGALSSSLDRLRAAVRDLQTSRRVHV
jgi:hypothetical protein